jgi:hypothetical protein
MTPEIYQFLASPIGDWMEIPGTWLSVNAGGQVLNERDGTWFGDVRYRDDMPYLLAGLLPAWSPEVIRATTTPAPYFFRRSRDDENPDRERSDLPETPHKPNRPAINYQSGPDLFDNYILEEIDA